MKVIEYSFELGLVVENVELLVVLASLIEMPDVVPNRTDLIVEVPGPEVRLELLECGLLIDLDYGIFSLLYYLRKVIFGLLVETRMLRCFIE